MGLQGLVRFLLPRENHFYEFLEQQAALAHEGAGALASFEKDSSTEGTRQRVQEVEHRGDKIVHDMEEALAKTFVTPIDREDIQKLSSELDDILDLANGAARATVLFGVDRPTGPMIQLMNVLYRCTGIIKAAVPKLRSHKYVELVADCRELRKLEKEGDTVYRNAISALFHDPAIDAKVLIREKAVLEDLENAIDHCNRIADTLTNLAVKHG